MRAYVAAVYTLLIVLCAPGNGSIAEARSTREQVRHTYLKEVGVREYGRNAGERVEQYLHSVGAAKGQAWCVAFVGYVLTHNNVPNPRSAWSPSYFSRQHVIWDRGVGEPPRSGDVFGIYYRNLGRVGHGGFIDEEDGDYYITVEGNTNQAGSREGDGVYRKRRPKSTIYKISRFIKD